MISTPWQTNEHSDLVKIGNLVNAVDPVFKPNANKKCRQRADVVPKAILWLGRTGLEISGLWY